HDWVFVDQQSADGRRLSQRFAEAALAQRAADRSARQSRRGRRQDSRYRAEDGRTALVRAGRHLRQSGGGELLQLRRHGTALRSRGTARGGRERRILSVRRARRSERRAREHHGGGFGTCSQKGATMSEPMNRREFVAAGVSASVLASEA